MRHIFLLALAFMLVLAACADEQDPADEPEAAEDDDEATEVEDDEAAEPETEAADPVTWTWNVSETGTQDSPFGQTAEYFAEELEERTDGQITVDLHFGGALGYAAGEMLEVVGEGFVDAGDLSLPHVSGTEPLTNFGALPLMHEGYDEHWSWLDDLFVPEMEETFQDQWNVVPIGSFTFGQMYLLWDEPFDEVEQLEGERFRVFNEVHGEFFEQAGVDPIYLPVEELATAMERGMMDGMPNSNPLILQLEAWEYYPYRNVLGAVTGSSLYAVNRDSFEALSPDLQDIVLEVGQDATEYGRDLLVEEDETIEQELDEQGMTTYEVPEETVAELRDLGEVAWFSWAEEVGPRAVELLEMTLEHR